MKMHWPQWSKNTGASLLLLMGLNIIGTPNVLLAQTPSPSQTGTDLGNWVKERLGSPEGIQERISNPLTSNGTSMTTLNGSTPFDAQLSCPSTNSFLRVSGGSTPLTNELSPLRIDIDTDLDGTFDYGFNAPFQVSGVCANGVISCTPGTWDDCSYYQWNSDNAANVSLSPTVLTNLGGCYCTNASCGSPSATILPKILKDLGGGIAASIQTINTQFSISNVSVSSSSVDYYGQNTRACTAQPSLSGTNNPEQYYGNPGGISTDTSTEVSAQSSNPSSYYSLMTGSLAATTVQSATSTCSVDRIVTVTTSTETISDSTTGTLCSDHYVYIRAYQVTPTIYHLQYLDTSPPPAEAPHWNCERRGTAGGIDDWHTLEIVNLPSAPTFFQFCMTATSACPASSTTCVSSSNTPINVMTCHGAGRLNPTYTRNYFFNFNQDTLSETINDSCSGLDTNPQCQLRDETVDSVSTYANYQPTGLNPIASCRTFTGSIGSYIQCKPWWSTDRTYRCGTGVTYDFSDARTRSEAINDSFSVSSGSFSYDDLQKESGTWVASSENVTLPPTPPTGTCEMSCKTSRPGTNTNATIAGNTSEFRTSTDEIDIFYKSCPISASGPSCPLDPGETLVVDCQCQNDFLYAATMMTVLDSAEEDLFCDGSTNPVNGTCTGTIRIFEGKIDSCRPGGLQTGGFNCCSNGSPALAFLRRCDASERVFNDARDNGQTHYIGERCIQSWPFGCLQEEKVYCRFNGKLGRIIHDEGRPQLQKFAPTGDWGGADNPNCVGFLPEELSMLDFNSMDLSGFFGDISAQTASQIEIENNIGSEINNFYNQLEQ